MAPNLDVIGAIEVAYDTTLSESDWVERIARTVSPAFGAGVAPARWIRSGSAPTSPATAA